MSNCISAILLLKKSNKIETSFSKVKQLKQDDEYTLGVLH